MNQDGPPPFARRTLASFDREIWSARDLAAYVDVHEDAVVSEAKKGTLPAYKLGHQWRFKSAIRAFEGKQGRREGALLPSSPEGVYHQECCSRAE